MECASRPLAWWLDPPASRHHESLPFAFRWWGPGPGTIHWTQNSSVQHRFIAHLLVPVRLRSLVHLYSFYLGGAWRVQCVTLAGVGTWNSWPEGNRVTTEGDSERTPEYHEQGHKGIRWFSRLVWPNLAGCAVQVSITYPFTSALEGGKKTRILSTCMRMDETVRMQFSPDYIFCAARIDKP